MHGHASTEYIHAGDLSDVTSIPASPWGRENVNKMARKHALSLKRPRRRKFLLMFSIIEQTSMLFQEDYRRHCGFVFMTCLCDWLSQSSRTAPQHSPRRIMACAWRVRLRAWSTLHMCCLEIRLFHHKPYPIEERRRRRKTSLIWHNGRKGLPR